MTAAEGMLREAHEADTVVQRYRVAPKREGMPVMPSRRSLPGGRTITGRVNLVPQEDPLAGTGYVNLVPQEWRLAGTGHVNLVPQECPLAGTGYVNLMPQECPLAGTGRAARPSNVG
jgi:hypothetical protein